LKPDYNFLSKASSLKKKKKQQLVHKTTKTTSYGPEMCWVLLLSKKRIKRTIWFPDVKKSRVCLTTQEVPV
jgi:hypothetical protein